jgi:hypothetical protein
MTRLRRFSEELMSGPLMHEFGFGDGKESDMFAMEFPRMLEHMLRCTFEMKKTHSPRKTHKPQLEEESNE